MRRARIVAVATLVSLGVAMSASMSAANAAPVTGWCAHKDNMAIFGTSADTGYGTTGYQSATDTFSRTRYGWSTKIADEVKVAWGTATQNYAHNGAMATDYLPGGRWTDTTAALADVAQHQPDLILIDLGGNELNAQVDPAVFQTNLGTLIDQIRAARPTATLVLSIYAELKWTPNPWGGQVQKYTWSQYASAIYQTAVGKGTAMVDLRQYIPPAASSDLPNPSPWLSDNIHLNDAGNLAEHGMWWGWVSSLGSIC